VKARAQSTRSRRESSAGALDSRPSIRERNSGDRHVRREGFPRDCARDGHGASAASRRRESRLMRSFPGTTVGATPKTANADPRASHRASKSPRRPGGITDRSRTGRNVTFFFFFFDECAPRSTPRRDSGVKRVLDGSDAPRRSRLHGRTSLALSTLALAVSSRWPATTRWGTPSAAT
jgi:hypothetical protein